MRGTTLTIASGTSKHGTNWKVTELKNHDQKFAPVYVIERNQGEHDERYFMIGHFYFDKDKAINKAKQLFI